MRNSFMMDPVGREQTDVATTISHNAVISDTTYYNRTYFNYFNPGTRFDVAMDCLLVITLLLALYLVLVLSYHEWFLYTSGSSNRKSGARLGKIYIAPWLRILCILSAIFCLLRCVNDIIYYKASTMSDIPCTVLKNMGVSWLIEVDTAVYLFLWLRQKVLYQKRGMKRLASPLVSFASWFALVLIIATFIVLNALLFWRGYHYDPVAAKCSSYGNAVSTVMPNLFFSSSGVLHGILVALYVYPLIRHTANLNRRRGSATPVANQGVRILKKQASVTSSGHKSLMEVVVICVVIAFICVLTDGLAVILAEYCFMYSHQTKLRHFIYDFNIVLNVFAIVGSFKNWKLMLFPYGHWKHSEGDILNSPKRGSPSTSINANVIHQVNTLVIVARAGRPMTNKSQLQEAG